MRPEANLDEAGEDRPTEATRQVGAWLQLFLRTIKTARLYGEQSPAASGFGEQMATSLQALLDAHGEVTLQFAAATISYQGIVVHRSQSRDDQLAMVFFRDGIQSLSLQPGIARSEIDEFLRLVAPMLGRERDLHEDLVTLLWEADLPHLDMRYVSAETELDLDSAPGERERTEALGPPMGWPSSAPCAGVTTPGTQDDGLHRDAAPGESGVVLESRSEDWSAGDPTEALDAEFSRIEIEGQAARSRFLAEREAERALAPRHAFLELLERTSVNSTGRADQDAIAPPLRRLLQESIAQGEWPEAVRALHALRHLGHEREAADFWRSLARPDSVLTRGVVMRLDQRPQAELPGFLSLITDIGPPAAPWLIRILGESQQQRVRRELVTTLAELSRVDLRAIEQSLDDARWYVVRNLAGALRALGGEQAAPLLARIALHPERRVRLEVLAALAEVPAHAARPILLRMLGANDPRELSGALRLLATGEDPEVAGLLMQRLREPDFVHRAPEEHRAVLSALVVTSAGAAVEPLAALLTPPRKPEPGAESCLTSVAQALSRIGTPAAKTVLEQARNSRWPACRDAATLALSTMRPR